MAPCQALRAEGAKNRKAHSPEWAVSAPQASRHGAVLGEFPCCDRPILVQEGSARSEVQPTLLPCLRILGLRSFLLCGLGTRLLPLSGPQLVYL